MQSYLVCRSRHHHTISASAVQSLPAFTTASGRIIHTQLILNKGLAHTQHYGCVSLNLLDFTTHCHVLHTSAQDRNTKVATVLLHGTADAVLSTCTTRPSLISTPWLAQPHHRPLASKGLAELRFLQFCCVASRAMAQLQLRCGRARHQDEAVIAQHFTAV